MQRIDDLQLRGLKIIQDPELFCFGTDAILLADFAHIPRDASVVDLGTGGGILPLLLYGRQPDAHFYAIEIQEALYKLAQESVEFNSLSDRIKVVQGDIKNACGLFGAGHDVVITNPPYEKVKDGEARKLPTHQIARKEYAITFEEICEESSRLLKTGGSIYLIHKCARLPELIYSMKKHRLEPKIMRMVHSKIGEEPQYVLMRGVKDGGEYLRVMPPLVLYDDDGEETDELRRVYNTNPR